jgi:DNA helicase-2/ATP-dependent DNA helicase PcrA
VARLSKYQKAVCEAIYYLARGDRSYTNGKDDLMIAALAGSGKTFILTYAMQYMLRKQRAIALMFNTRNADDIRPKLPAGYNVEARTTHSLGGRVLKRNGGGVLDEDHPKMRGILNEMQLPLAERRLLPEVKQLISVAKALGIVPHGYQGAWGLQEDTPEVWRGILDHFSIDFDEDWQEERAIAIARDALKISLDTAHKFIDYDDMLYLPVVLRMPFPKYDWVFADECQDLSPLQHEMLKRARKPGGHIVFIGDENQAIYGWRGAGVDSMRVLKEDLDAHELPLSICYRCDKEIIRHARHIVPAIEYWDQREEGKVMYGLGDGTRQQKLAEFTPDAVILGPRNAPLVAAAFGFIRKRIACHMIGRDFSEGLVKLLQKLDARIAVEAEARLEEYRAAESIRLEGRDAKLQSMLDKCDTLRVFLSDAPPNESVARIIAQIEALFDETAQGMLTLCSIHRSKGGEWNRVFLMDTEMLGATTTGSKDKTRSLLPWEMQQRKNLLYVGVTRAMHELYFVTVDDMEDLFR